MSGRYWIPTRNRLLDEVAEADAEAEQSKQWLGVDWLNQSAPQGTLAKMPSRRILSGRPKQGGLLPQITTTSPYDESAYLSPQWEKPQQEEYRPGTIAEGLQKGTLPSWISLSEKAREAPKLEGLAEMAALPWQVAGATVTAPFREGVPKTARGPVEAIGQMLESYKKWQDPRIFPWQDILVDAYKIGRRAEGLEEGAIQAELDSGVRDYLFAEGSKTFLIGQGIGVKDIADNAPDIAFGGTILAAKLAPKALVMAKQAIKTTQPLVKDLVETAAEKALGMKGITQTFAEGGFGKGEVPKAPASGVTKQLWEMTDDELLKVIDLDTKARVVRFPKGGKIISTYPRQLNYKEGLSNFRQVAKKEGLTVKPEKAIPAEAMVPKERPIPGVTSEKQLPKRIIEFEDSGGVKYEIRVLALDRIEVTTIPKRFPAFEVEGIPRVPIGASYKSLDDALGSVPKTAKKVDDFIPTMPKAIPKTEPGMAPSTSVQTGLPGIGKEGAQAQLFGEVSGKESRKVPLTEVSKRAEVPEGQARLAEGRKPPSEPPKVIVKEGGIPKEFAGNIRLSKFPKEVHDDLLNWAEDTAKVEVRRRGVRSHAVTLEDAQKIADKTGGNPEKIAKSIGSAYNAEEAKAIDGMLVQADNELQQVKRLVESGQNTTGNLLRLKQAQEKTAYWTAIATSARAEAGRALESYKIVNSALKSNDVKLMESVLKRVGGRDNMEKVAEAMKGLDWNNPIAINNFIRSMNKPKLKDYVFEVYVNSILSGPKTHIVNTLSNAMTAIISPVETVGGAVVERGLAKLAGRAPTRFIGESVYEASASLKGFQDGVRGALHTLRFGVRPGALSKYEFRPGAFGGRLGRVVNFPSTALEAADELFYNINYRMALNKYAYRASKARGLSGKKLFEDMADMVANPTEDLIENASKQAQYRLFRQEAGKTTQKLMAMREDVPVLKFFVPFLRTPVNLVKFGLERSPAGFLNPKLWKNLMAKNPEAADQIARAFIGSAVATALYYYVKDRRITGGAPTNASQRDQFYAEGKQPYAVKIGDNWVSYQRLEPFNQMLSQLAALVDAVGQDDKTVQEKLGIIAKDIGSNFVSQTYMSGISDIIDALSDPERYGTGFVNRLAGSLAVPYSAASRTVAQMFDPTIRKPTNVWEGIQTNIPGLSQQVPAKTNLAGTPQIRQSPAWSPISITSERVVSAPGIIPSRRILGGGGGGGVSPITPSRRRILSGR